MNVFLRLNINVMNYFLIYVRMLVVLRMSHVIVIWWFAPKRGSLKVAYWVLRQKQRIFSDDKVGCRRKIVIDVECMDLHSEAAWEYITLE